LKQFTISESWDKVLKEEYTKPYFLKLAAFVKEQRLGNKPIFPSKGQVFYALQKTPYEKVKVVIVGQDPYHGEGQAHGLCFSVPHGIAAPPSLKNIFKELQSDVSIPLPSHGCLEKWTDEGVLLLNATLTVASGSPLSHANQGWEQFTDEIIRSLSKRDELVIFLLWGRNAIEKCKHVDANHIIFTAPHPSPFSAHTGFLGCKHFSKANEALKKLDKEPIDWRLD
jgi:uracil-DNA glycosylase